MRKTLHLAVAFAFIFPLVSCKCTSVPKEGQATVIKPPAPVELKPLPVEKLDHKQFLARMRAEGWMRPVKDSDDVNQLGFINEIEQLGQQLDKEGAQGWKYGNLRVGFAGRLLIDVEVNHHKFLMYRSTGEAAKQEGQIGLSTAEEWVPLPGIAEDGWFIKGVGIFGAQEKSKVWPRKPGVWWSKINKYGSQTFKKIADDLKANEKKLFKEAE